MSQFYSQARGLVPNLDIPYTETIILTANFTARRDALYPPLFENFEKVRKNWHSLKSSVVLVPSYLMRVNSKNQR